MNFIYNLFTEMGRYTMNTVLHIFIDAKDKDTHTHTHTHTRTRTHARTHARTRGV